MEIWKPTDNAGSNIGDSIKEGSSKIKDSILETGNAVANIMSRDVSLKESENISKIKQEIMTCRTEIIQILSMLNKQSIYDYFDNNPDDLFIIDDLKFLQIDVLEIRQCIELLNLFSDFLNGTGSGFISHNVIIRLKRLLSGLKIKDSDKIIELLDNLFEDKNIFAIWDIWDMKYRDTIGFNILSSDDFFDVKPSYFDDFRYNKHKNLRLCEFTKYEEGVDLKITYEFGVEPIVDDAWGRYGVEEYMDPVYNYIEGIVPKQRSVLALPYYIFPTKRNEAGFKWSMPNMTYFAGFDSENHNICVQNDNLNEFIIENANILHFILNCGSKYGVNTICDFLINILDTMTKSNDCFNLLDKFGINPYRLLFQELKKDDSINNTINRLPEIYKMVSKKFNLSYFYDSYNEVFTNRKGQSQKYFNCERMNNSILRYYREFDYIKLYCEYLNKLKDRIFEIRSRIECDDSLINNNEALKTLRMKFRSNLPKRI